MKLAIFCFGTLALAVALNLCAGIPQGEALAASCCLLTIAWGAMPSE